MNYAPLKIPLHGKGTALAKLALWADMATLNPKGFRTMSEKKNRRRAKVQSPKSISVYGRLLSHAEKLNQEIAA
jgi:hypothetical protein